MLIGRNAPSRKLRSPVFRLTMQNWQIVGANSRSRRTSESGRRQLAECIPVNSGKAPELVDGVLVQLGFPRWWPFITYDLQASLRL